MKKSTFYFSHDYNAANDFKILFLRQKYGMEGYGIYWFIIESLAQSNGELPYTIIPILAMQIQVDESVVNSIINDFDLFVQKQSTSGKVFSSSRLLQHLELRNNLKEKGKIGAAKRWGISNPNGNPNGKEIKGNEINSLSKIKIE